MLAAEMEVIKDIPCYRVVLQAVIKYQIQQLMSQLSEHTEEESVILSANSSDGTVTYQGTALGETFLQAHTDFKSKFLNFCNKSLGLLRVCEAMREVRQAPDTDLKVPALVRSSNMRKYMATMLQVLNTTEAEQQWVLDNLGPKMNVQQTSDVLDPVNIAKVLLIEDLKLVSKYKGQKIQDIPIEEMFEVADCAKGCDEEAPLKCCEKEAPLTPSDEVTPLTPGDEVTPLTPGDEVIPLTHKLTPLTTSEKVREVTPNEVPDEVRDVLNIMETNEEELISPFLPTDEAGSDSHDDDPPRKKIRKIKKSTRKTWSSDGDDDDEPPRKKRIQIKKSTRKTWSEEEVSELHCLFAEDFLTNTLPGQTRIESVMKESKKQEGFIFRRKRDTIKKKLSNMMIKRRKELIKDGEES